MPPGTSESEIEQYEAAWRCSIIEQTDEPLLAKKHYAVRSRNTYDGGYIYVFQSERFYKIGRSYNVKARLKMLRSSSPLEVQLIVSIQSPNPSTLEKELHFRFQDKHIRGEWYELSTNDLMFLKELANPLKI